GSYTVKVTVTDKDGASGDASFKVDVSNLPPAVTPPSDQSSDEGSAKSFDLGSFTDPGANDNPWKVHVDWGDTTSSNPADRSATASSTRTRAPRRTRPR